MAKLNTDWNEYMSFYTKMVEIKNDNSKVKHARVMDISAAL